MDLDRLNQTEQQSAFTRAGCIWSLVFSVIGLCVYAGAYSLVTDFFGWIEP
jgi:hypothetical protein